MKTRTVYIATTPEDATLLAPVIDALRDLGVPFTLDPDALTGGASAPGDVGDSASPRVLILWTKAASKSETVTRALQHAQQTRQEIIPVIIDKTPWPPAWNRTLLNGQFLTRVPSTSGTMTVLRKIQIGCWWAFFTFVFVLLGTVFIHNGGEPLWAATAAGIVFFLSLLRTWNFTFDTDGWVMPKDASPAAAAKLIQRRLY